MLLMSFGDRFVSRVFFVAEIQKQLEIGHLQLCALCVFVPAFASLYKRV